MIGDLFPLRGLLALADHVDLRPFRFTGITRGAGGITALPGQLPLDMLGQVEVQRLLEALDCMLALDYGVFAVLRSSVLLHPLLWQHVILLAQRLVLVLEQVLVILYIG